MTYFKYIMSSQRFWLDDEQRNVFRTTKELQVGDSLEFDGIKWYVDEVLGKEVI